MSCNRDFFFHGVGSLWRGLRLKALMVAWLISVGTQPTEAEAIKASIRIMVFGDSLTAGYQLPADSSFPAVLERHLKVVGHKVEVINASVSGDTATAGLERLQWSLVSQPDVVILELGANDMLRGIDVDITYRALDSILHTLREKKISVLLTGMKASRGLGLEYRNNFESMYPRLAIKHDVRLYPFFLEGVAGQPEFNLSDGIHPNAAGVQQIVDRIGPIVSEMLRDVENMKK